MNEQIDPNPQQWDEPLLFCDFCYRSEVALIIDGGEDLLKMKQGGDYMVCEDCEGCEG